MPRIDVVKTEVFKFNELPEEAQQTALESLWDINVDHNWWEYDYEDAAQIGLKITEFDLDRYSIDGDFTEYAEDVAANIVKNHGEQCETHQTAKNFLDDQKNYDNDTIEAEDAEYEFKRSLLEDYRIILQKEYDYRTSEAAIKETIECNEYEFTAEGNLY